MSRLLAVAVLIALVLAASATAATPVQYRAKVNGICRGYTPKLQAIEKRLTAAQKAKDTQALGVALGEYLVTGLAQDTKIEAVAVPVALKPTMRPILATLKLIDTHVRGALLAAANGDQAQFGTHLTAIQKLGKPLNAKLDAAGLRDCGSNQQ